MAKDWDREVEREARRQGGREMSTISPSQVCCRSRS